MLKENAEIFSYCNIPKWWEGGFTGKGVKIGILADDYDETEEVFDNKAHGIYKFGTGINGATHGFKVTHVLHQVAPDAELYYLPLSHGANPAMEFDNVIQWCIESGINIISLSNIGTNADWFREGSRKAFLNGITLICAGGNFGDGLDTLTFTSKDEIWISIGAYELVKGEPRKASYSSTGKELDFACLTNVYVGSNPKSPLVFDGTSCSCPIVVGMLALWFQYFKDVYGRFPKQSEVYEFMKENCVDLNANGFDNYAGWGLFRLPDKNGVEIALKVGSVVYMVNGEKKLMDVYPRLENDRVMVPVRFVSEALGCKVEWDDKNQVVTITKE